MIRTSTFSFTKMSFLFCWVALLSVLQTVHAQAPIITLFSPTSGPVGTTVTISGSGFSATANQNIVFFGAVKATVTVASTTSLTVTVPVGATYEPISVLNGTSLLVGYSTIPFTTTFTPNKKNVTTDDIKPLVNFSTGTNSGAFSVAVKDFDGDGKTDIAVGNYNGNSISIFLNTSVSGSITASSFAAKVDFPVTLPRGVTAGDFDGDGKPDLAVTASSSNSVVIFKNTSSGVGNINFVNQLSVPTGTGPFTVAVGDIDYDGRPDLAVTNNSTTTISVIRNTSSGVGVFSFAGKIDFILGTAPYGISLGDMDGDGKVDVVIPLANAVGSVTILRNTSTSGTISFDSQVSFTVGAFPFYLAVGDLNKDGKADIAAANGGASLVSILQNTSSGIGNINFAPKVDLPTIPSANTVAFSDIDGDGNPDMVLASNSNILSFFHNASPVGGTISFGNRVDFANSNNARAMAIADFDGDGKNDVLTGNNGSSNISVFHNDPLLAPTVQATNVVFTGTTGTATTASWTNGNGSSRAVFMYAGSSGSPVPVDFTTYTANAAFGTGTQIGTTGWYCVYKGTDSTVNITGLTSGVAYQVMTVEYNGSIAGNEVYFSTISTVNPAAVTAIIGPGGVTSNLKLWLKANLSVTPATQGAAVTTWNDQSGNNNNAVYSTPMFTQTVLNPTYQVNSLNFNPTLYFGGTSNTNFAAIGGNLSPALTSTNISAYIVSVIYTTASASGRVFMISVNPTTSDWQNVSSADLMGRNGSNVFGTRNGSNSPILGPVVGRNVMLSSHFTTTNQWLYEVDGNPFSATTYATAVFNSAYYRLGMSTYSTNDYLNGNIAEVILYDADQSSLAGHNQIESYLSLKYGLHKVGSYVNSSGITIWNATLNALYHNDVFGIGQDNGGTLLQTQSNSTNTGTGNGTGQTGKGNIIISNPSSLANNGFLMIGHDTGALTEIVVPIAGLSIKKVQRNWKVQTTGTPGTVTLSYDVTGLTYSAQSFTDYVLLVDPTGTGDFTGGTVVKYPAVSLTANKVSFNAVTLPTGAVFSFQTLAGPTVQATNVNFANTTGTSSVINWTNGNGSSRAVFVFAGSTGSPVPVSNTTYTANTVFGTGTQIGTTGWYCVYNGTGTTVNVTGLNPATAYRVMTVEYTGTTGNEVYLSTTGTGNPAGFTTTSLMSPGGVAGEAVWYKANEGVTLNTTNVAQWNDFSANANNAIQATASSQPLYVENSINFNQAVTFSGSNYLTAPVNNLPSGNSARSVFMVATSANTQSSASWVYGYGANSRGNAFNGGKLASQTFLDVSGFSEDVESSVSFWVTNAPKLATITYSTPTVSFFDAGNPIGTASQTNWNTIVTANSGRIGAFASTSFDLWQGKVAEVILYPSLVTGNAAISIESYLAIKYGIHKTGNYLNSAGAIVWDATANAVYHNDVFGVGKDDLSGLSQGLSNSMNTGDGGGMGQSGKGNIVINAVSTSLANNTFVIIGHDTNALSEIIVPLTAGLNIKRIQRIWRVQTTGTPGTVTLSYDITGLTYSTSSSSNYFILIDPTGLGNFTGGSVVKYPATMISANKVIFRDVLLPTGAVFTIQTLASPTVQATNVVFTGTTGTTTTASWTNGNGTSRAVFIYAGASGSPVPVNNTSYTANTVFGTGTQIGATGWYCVYNGTGTTVNVTGLTPATTYQVMTVEYNGTSGNELYLTTTATGNPAAVTTLSNVATLSNLSISQGTLAPVFATATTAYTATVPNAITSLTLTPTTTSSNATVKVKGTTVTSGSASGTINLAVGPNVITTVVTAQDGTTIGTYTVTVTRTVPTILTTGTLSALTTIYGTPSASATFNVSGTDMATGILVTPPAGFEVSTDNVTFTNTVTVGAAGIIVSTPVYVRLKGTAPAGSYSGNVVLTSTNATTVNITTVSSTVNKASLTITADNKSKGYGGSNPALTVSYSGFVNGDTPTNLATLPTIATTAITASLVGTYPITASGAVGSNYTISYVAGTLTVTPVVLTITAVNKSKAYGAANPALTVSYSGFVNGDTAASLTTPPTIATTAVTASSVGTYPITASGAVGSNYTISYIAGTLTVTPVALTITAVNKSKAYGGANPTLTVSYSGFVNGDTAANLTTQPTIATTAVTTSPVGTYPITASGAVGSNYTISYVAGTLTVTAATLTITADNKSKAYGAANPALTATYTGFVNGDTAASLTTLPTISTTALMGSDVGAYPITASGAVGSNYTISYVAGILTVTPVALTITAANKSKAYGAANPTLTVSYSGFVNGDTAASLATLPAIATTAITASPVGTYPITASGAVGSNYTISYVAGTLTVTPVVLTITAANKSKTYGAANPALTVSYSGFVNGDTAASLTTPPTIVTTAVTASLVGTYPITASGAVGSNYTISYIAGTLTVTPVALTITGVNKSKVYGAANPALTVSYSGFVNGDTASSFTTQPTIATTAVTASPVGTYPITASGAVNPNYTISYVAGTLTVTAVTLTITADNKSKAYGAVNPALTVSYTGFVNGDTAASLTTLPTISTTALIGSDVGTYPITASGAVSSNYTIAYVNGTLTVTPVVLTITPNNGTKTYGSVNPTLTVSYSGFANGDTATSLDTLPTISTTAITSSAVGTYTITASGAVSSNYSINYGANGTLTVTPVALTITANNQIKTYGDANPTLTVTYTGFANGDTVASLTTLPTISTTAVTGSAVGTYPITASGAASTNYTISYIDGTLTVTTATLIVSITADNKTKAYGSVNPPLTVTYTGFVNGDTSADLTTQPTIGTTAVTSSPVGTYPITASGATSPNYIINEVDGTLTVTPVALTITIDDKTKAYGVANPTLTATYTGFVNGDTEVDLTTQAAITTTGTIGSIVGTYPITASGAASINYTISYVAGNLTVKPVALTITADNQSKIYGDANPTLTVSYTGFVNGDTETSLTTPPTITTTADLTSPVGGYSITANGAVDTNYTISYVGGSLTVTPVTLTITADDQTKIYGDANPTLTVSYSGFVNGDTEASLLTPPTVATTAAIGSPVGSYPIVASAGADPNYTFNYIDGNLTVTVATLTVTAENQTKAYGDANPILTLSYSGFVNGETEASLLTPPTAATTATIESSVGTYPIVASAGIDPNYTFSYVDGNLTVTPVTLTITADNQSKVYGDANPTLTVSYSGFVNGDTAASLATPPTISTTAITASPVGTYPITASGAVDANYTISYVDGNLSVTPVTLTITADAQTKVYGDANPTLTVSYSGFVNGDTAASLTTLPTISTTAVTASPVGTYPITASGAVDANYTISYVDGTLTVTPVTLTITADNQSKVYGDANPTLTVSSSGFVNGDTAASLTTAPTITTTADTTSPVGTYSITASGAVDANYTISYVDGSLTVTPVVLTITADDQSKIYGDANPTLTVSYSGFVNGDTEASLTTSPIISTTAGATSGVGTYPITASGAVSMNYTFSYVDGTLTVTPVTLTITADDQSKIYGDANPTLTVSYLGFVNGDTVSSLTTAPTISTTADTASPVGTYPIMVSGAVDANYTISYVAGTLTVTPVALTITADNQSKIYGDANPSLTVSYTGFVNGDTAASLTTAPTISTTADTASPVGTYPIMVSGAVDANYTISYVAGTLTVTPVALTITADNQSKIYGDVNPTLTVSYSGFVNGDTAASLTTAPTISTTADTASPVGAYPITASGAVDANYTISYVAGTLTVTPVALTITADNQSKIYGDANPSLTVSYTGFVNGDTAASLTTAPTISTTADTTSPVGTYPITASGAVDVNYTISYVAGTLTVTPVALTITADNQSKIYGDANPALTVSYSGFVNGDTAASLTIAPTISTTADTASPVGTYPITASGAVDTNYTISYVAGTLTVTPVALTITADNQSKIYGDANPILTVSYSGFVNGDTVSSLTTAPTISTTADTASPVGTYPITASGAVDVNYTISYVAGTLTVTPVVLTITADNQSKIYGDANPALTVSYSGFVNGDTAASLTTAPTISTTADTASPVGTYPITAIGAVDANYTISYVAGTLTITPANLAIVADDKTKIYGEANPVFTFNYTGFVNGDTEASLTTPPVGATAANATSPVGIYPITISGATSANYTIGYTTGANLTITPANLAIAADDKTKIYGEANPVFTFNYTGFVNGDTEASLTTPPVGATTADATSPVGVYPITISGATSANYTIGYTTGANLTITPANLAIAADDKTKIYGEANPVFTFHYTGFVNGDTEASLTTPPVGATTANATSPVGIYPITISGATSGNYTIGYTTGANLTITPANLAIAADNKAKIYGEANPVFTFNYTGFVNGDTEASLTTPPVGATTADATSPVGVYPITISGATSANYTIGYTAGATLTITPADLVITADNQSKIYGDANPTLTASYSGFVNGDSASSFTTLPTISTTAVLGSPVGTYPITGSGAVNPNYTISYVDGNLTVTTAILIVTVDNQSKVYGDANPTLTASYSGFVNGDTTSSFTTLPTITTTAVVGSPVGTYPITANGAVNPNYTISYVDGNLIITTATLTIKADDKTRVYGAPNPTLTATYTGFINGDTVASLTTPPTISTIANATSPVGVYAITVNGAAASNYSIVNVTGILTITTVSDVNLTSLTINNGTLSPAFSPNVILYNVTVTSNIASENITTIADDPLATITINGNAVQSGSASTVSLSPGQNTVVVKVVGEDGITTKSYTLIITRESASITTLSNLSISSGTLDPAFTSNVTDYNAVVKYNVNSITVLPTATDPLANITVNGLVVASGTASTPIILNPGNNTIETVITAQDGITKETYTINVYKGVSPDALVINNILSPNGDGKNDFWEIKDIQLFPNNKVTVFDRAGRIIYSKNGYSNEWDGAYSGSPLNNDTYYYLIDLGDDIPKIKGFITIIRD